jgi:hypothetical protein
MAESATTINENGVRGQYAVARRVVQRSSTFQADGFHCSESLSNGA